MGMKWLWAHMQLLEKAQIEFFLMKEREPFRFGAGPKVHSQWMMVFPIFVDGQTVWLRSSVVEQGVPLLMSRSAWSSHGFRR